MTRHYQYSIRDLENMIPWEREVYVALLLESIDEENERSKTQ
jgi:hypothetical protein